MPSFAGLRGTGNWAADQRPRNFRELILWRNPNGQTPLTALLGKTKAETTDDAEFSWWDESTDIIQLQINKSGGYSATATLLTIDSTDPDAINPENRWGSALNLVPGDVLMVQPATDTVAYTAEHMLVTEVHSATEFSVTRGYAGTTAATIADDIYIVKIGTSYAEGTDAPQSSSRNPTKFFNYTQIFKTAYELTRTARGTTTRTGDPLSVEKMRKTHDHSVAMEMAFMFGSRSEIVGSNGKPQRTTGGLRSMISSTTTTILANNWTISNSATDGNNLVAALSKVFEFESGAGDERIVFAGNGALNAMNNAISKGTGMSAISINTNTTEKLYGMNFTRLTMPQGTVMIKTHPLMNRNQLYTNSMFVLDFNAIKYRPFENGKTKQMDDIQAKGEDLVRGQWLTEAGLEVQAGGLTCGYIGGFGSSIG